MLYSMPRRSASATKSRMTFACSSGPGTASKTIVALARPAELGDDDALAGVGLAQQLDLFERVAHRLLGGGMPSQ